MDISLKLFSLLCLVQLASCYYYQECTYSYLTGSWWCRYRRAVIFSSIAFGTVLLLIAAFLCCYCCIATSVRGIRDEPYVFHTPCTYCANGQCACVPYDPPTAVMVVPAKTNRSEKTSTSVTTGKSSQPRTISISQLTTSSR